MASMREFSVTEALVRQKRSEKTRSVLGVGGGGACVPVLESCLRAEDENSQDK